MPETVIKPLAQLNQEVSDAPPKATKREVALAYAMDLFRYFLKDAQISEEHLENERLYKKERDELVSNSLRLIGRAFLLGHELLCERFWEEYRELAGNPDNFTIEQIVFPKIVKVEQGHVLRATRLSACLSTRPFDLTHKRKKLNDLLQFESKYLAYMKEQFLYAESEGLEFSVRSYPCGYELATVGTWKENNIELNGVDMGDYLVHTIIPNNRPVRIYVRNIDESFLRRGFPHPHVDHNELLCLGEGFLLIEDLSKEFRFGEIKQIVHSILTTYNENSPYLRLAFWENDIEVENCASCGAEILTEILEECHIGDEIYCENCVQVCENCAEVHPLDRMVNGDLCETCYEEVFTCCYLCGDSIYLEDVHLGDSENYCDECYRYIYTTCDHCYIDFLRKENVGDEDAPLCPDCASVCDNCGESSLIAELSRTDTGNWLCFDCYKEHEEKRDEGEENVTE